MTEAERRAPIMVATDFSETAATATEWAAQIARAHEAPLVVVHAVHLHGPVTDFIPSPPDLEEHLQGAAVARLQETVAELIESGLEVDSRLEVGTPSRAIVEAAEETEPALLVIGTRGLSGLAHLLLGSTAERVVQHAPCPVLSVHPTDRGAWQPAHTILLPTDFSADAECAMAVAERLLANGGEHRLVLLHAYHLPMEYTAYGTIPTALTYQHDVASSAEERLAVIAERLDRPGLAIETIAREGYPPELIVDVAAEVGADVIAMGTHGRSGLKHLLLGSNAERVVQRAPCPVLTVRHPECGD